MSSEANPDQLHLSVGDMEADIDVVKVNDEPLVQEASSAIEATMELTPMQKLQSPMITFFSQAWLQNFELLKQYKVLLNVF